MGVQNVTPSVTDSMGRTQYPVWINESGLYSLILGSKLEKAKVFKHWVTSEVLPTIRKTGGYINQGQEDLFIDTSCTYQSFAVFLYYQDPKEEQTTDMKKNLKKYLIILLAAIMIFSLPLSASAATKKNVTKTYKKSVTRMLRGFDSYFGYCCGKNQYFKFDNYARTTMTYMRNYSSDNRLSTVKKKLRPQLKLYFNTSTVKFKKFTKYGIPRNPSYLFCNKNGRIIYTGGDWGEVAPKGFVKKIIRTSSNKFEVTYNVYMYDDWAKKNYGHIGTYKIYLKKAKNKNGFVITNIKQTASKKIWL